MKINLRHIIGLFSLLLLSASLFGHTPPGYNEPGGNQSEGNEQTANFRNDCTKPEAQIDQDINNVRARLTTGGDVWWDRNDGRYIIPKPNNPGDPEVSSIFAGGVWLGGIQEGFKVAAQQYGNGNGNTRDFWTGPLNPSDDPNLRGTTADSICRLWDRFFVVTGDEINLHIAAFQDAQSQGTTYDPANIPLGVKGWPGKGNPFFFSINNFNLPNTTQGLGSFFDENGDEVYNPIDGDYPVIEIEGCNAPQYPDQMFFWIYNDAGNNHTESNGDKIRMEIQVQSFAYETADALNDMTFQRYKLINRASLPIDSTYFAMWVDADVGCYTDDYIGCDTVRSLAYYYNSDATDGTNGAVCDQGVATYGEEIPALGIDYFRGPKKPIFDPNDPNEVIDEVELGMSSFGYFNNPGEGPPPAPETDPSTVIEYYNYMRGFWKDGTPYTFGGNGYGGDPSTAVSYVFPDPPNDPDGWSMCTATEFNNPDYDRRTVQASGPFTLLPGAVNELIIGAVWTPNLEYPCPDLSRFFAADDLAQNLFDACFDVLDGPDAPDIDIIELDEKLILVLSNDENTAISNNANESYSEVDISAPMGSDTLFKFQGYKIYQLRSGDVSSSELNNPDQARLIFQVDKRDGITKIYNWMENTEVPDFIENPSFVSTLEVNGSDGGISHTFVVDNDQFSDGTFNNLVNHKKYYFSAIAYAYNNWQEFDPVLGEGQRTPYLIGRRKIQNYTGIPRIIADINVNSDYGDGAFITRFAGEGNGGNFLDLNNETREAIENSSGFEDGDVFNEPIVYRPNRGPFDVTVYNPLEVKDGNYELTILDDNFEDSGDLDQWRLVNPATGLEITSDVSIDDFNEQIISELGITISVTNPAEPGSAIAAEMPENVGQNGAVGTELEYIGDVVTPWYLGVDNNGANVVGEAQFLAQGLNFADGTDISEFDPMRGLVDIGQGIIPYQITEFDLDPAQYPFGNVSPAWQVPQGSFVRNIGAYGNLNNVDIVFTSNKDQWSRCVIVETTDRFIEDLGFTTEGGMKQFFPRGKASVSKEDENNDGLPDPDDSGTMGMGWFPGYAVDVETGQRLNIFFGESSVYNCDGIIPCNLYQDEAPNGDDMMFNPSSQLGLEFGDPMDFTSFNLLLGGRHFFYVTNTPYDECEDIYEAFSTTSPSARIQVLSSQVTWSGVPMTNGSARMKSYGDGLIPTDLRLKIRVDNEYDYEEGVQDIDTEAPTYGFSIEGKEASELSGGQVDEKLDLINVVPNPYYAFSQYERTNSENIVKITNLPAKCVVTIYSVDGKFIRQYNRDEAGGLPNGSGVKNSQSVSSIDWNLKNSRGIPIAGGVYLIHVDAFEMGERIIKWFGSNREFDPSGL